MTPQRPLPQSLPWPLLEETRRKALVALLSELLARRLPAPVREADDEQP
jgi:hypothetical protein